MQTTVDHWILRLFETDNAFIQIFIDNFLHYFFEIVLSYCRNFCLYLEFLVVLVNYGLVVFVIGLGIGCFLFLLCLLDKLSELGLEFFCGFRELGDRFEQYRMATNLP